VQRLTSAVLPLRVLESSRQGQGVASRWGDDAPVSKSPSELHQPGVSSCWGGQLVAPMQRMKGLSQPVQELFALACQSGVGLLRKKSHVLDQVGHAELDHRSAVRHVLVIGREIVAPIMPPNVSPSTARNTAGGHGCLVQQCFIVVRRWQGSAAGLSTVLGAKGDITAL